MVFVAKFLWLFHKPTGGAAVYTRYATDYTKQHNRYQPHHTYRSKGKTIKYYSQNKGHKKKNAAVNYSAEIPFFSDFLGGVTRAKKTTQPKA